jgi:uncharacterized protein (DUF849 family)
MKNNHPFQPYPPLILNCCLTGCVVTKEITPHVPLSVTEIIAEGVKLAEAGVSILHLHARDAAGRPTWSKEIYRRIICGIRESNPEVILCVSSSGRFWSDFERRSEVLELNGEARPDMGSLTLGSMNFKDQSSLNQPDMIRRLAKKMADNGIKPELEVFDLGMIHMVKILRREGLLTGPVYINLILGNPGTAPPDLGALSLLVDNAGPDSVLAVSGLGISALPVHMAGLAAGLHVRFGLEDQIYFDMDKKLLATNFTLLGRLVEMAELLSRPVANQRQTRHLLGM